MFLSVRCWVMCTRVFMCVDFRSAFGAGTPVASFPVARREPAFRLLFNKPADRAYWLWMDRDPRRERQGKRKRGNGGEEGGGGKKLGQRRRGKKC